MPELPELATRKVGPLPVIGWVIVAGLGVVGFRWFRGRSTSSKATTSSTVDESLPSLGGTAAPGSMVNEQWQQTYTPPAPTETADLEPKYGDPDYVPRPGQAGWEPAADPDDGLTYMQREMLAVFGPPSATGTNAPGGAWWSTDGLAHMAQTEQQQLPPRTGSAGQAGGSSTDGFMEGVHYYVGADGQKYGL